MNWQELSLDNLKSEVKENLRLRLGLWLSLGIVLTWVSLVWSDTNAELYQSLRGIQQDSLALQDIESADVWMQRYEQSARQLSGLRSNLWTADSEGLARAKLQAQLAGLSKPTLGGSQSIKVGSAQAVADVDGVSRLRARVGVVLSPEATYQLLASLESSEQLIVVEQLNLKLVKGNWSVEFMISAYFSSSQWSV